MTNEQKHLIECLRAAGQGYTAVAKAVGLPKETVKSFCRRYSVFGNHTQAVVKEKKRLLSSMRKSGRTERKNKAANSCFFLALCKCSIGVRLPKSLDI